MVICEDNAEGGRGASWEFGGAGRVGGREFEGGAVVRGTGFDLVAN